MQGKRDIQAQSIVQLPVEDISMFSGYDLCKSVVKIWLKLRNVCCDVVRAHLKHLLFQCLFCKFSRI